MSDARLSQDSPPPDHAPWGAGGRLVLDADAQVLDADTAAWRLLGRDAADLVLSAGRLGARQDAHRWMRAVATAAAGQASAWAATLGRDHPPCSARLQPAGDGRVSVTLVDPSLIEVDPDLLVPMLGLTLAEARVVAGLARGLSTRQLAQHLGVQVNTVQSHVKRALHKTGLKRQTGLITFVLRSAAVTWRPP
jgi:DNA-binding CsgD family transcriptional regulator